MSNQDIIGETVVRGVKLEMTRDLAEGGFALAWTGSSINGSADFDKSSNPSKIWSEAIRSLRENPATYPVAETEPRC